MTQKPGRETAAKVGGAILEAVTDGASMDEAIADALVRYDLPAELAAEESWIDAVIGEALRADLAARPDDPTG